MSWKEKQMVILYGPSHTSHLDIILGKLIDHHLAWWDRWDPENLPELIQQSRTAIASA